MISTIKDNSSFGSMPANLTEAFKMAEYLSKSNIIPKAYIGKPADILVAMQMGAEIGLFPLQSLNNIYCIQGTPTLSADVMLAIVRANKEFEDIKEYRDDKGTAVCEVKRKNNSWHKVTFTLENAKTAGLLPKDNWKKYPERMLQLRARTFALKDTFGDVIKGLSFTEEVMDYDTNIPISTQYTHSHEEKTDSNSEVNKSEEKDSNYYFQKLMKGLEKNEFDQVADWNVKLLRQGKINESHHNFIINEMSMKKIEMSKAVKDEVNET